MPVLILDPVDTLLLRDGRPFNQDDAGLTRAFSHFPPFPWVTASAVRAAIARTTGWSERQGKWQDQRLPERRCVLDCLGDGLFDTGDLTFDAPLIARAGGGSMQTVGAALSLSRPSRRPHAEPRPDGKTANGRLQSLCGSEDAPPGPVRSPSERSGRPRLPRRRPWLIARFSRWRTTG